MTILTCLDVETAGAVPTIYNAMVVAAEDYEFLRSIWSDFFPSRWMAVIDDFRAESGDTPPVWIGWYLLPNGNWKHPGHGV